MSLKRRNTSSPESDDSPVSKRRRPSLEEDSDESFDHPYSNEQPRSHPVYGQKGAFPGLDDNDDELFYGPPSDGLEYLRMVRSEAKGVPHLLVAPRSSSDVQILTRDGDHSCESEEQAGGYYADGAYTAAPPIRHPTVSKHPPPDAQDIYYDTLSARFKLLQATLKCSPPLSAVNALPPSTLISLSPATEAHQSQWRYHLQSSDPLTVQLACMDFESVLEVVKLLTGTMAQTTRSRSQAKIWRFGAWAWGILGKCRDRTELGSEEIAILRELGKRAVQLLVRVRETAGKATDPGQELLQKEGADIAEPIPSGALAAEADLEDADVVDGISFQKNDLTPNRAPNSAQDAGALEAAKKRLAGTLLSNDDIESSSSATPMPGGHDVTPATGAGEKRLCVDQQIRATLDMIVTIVGEFYGQRDLLEFRDIWEQT